MNNLIPNKVYGVLFDTIPMILLFTIVMISIRAVTIISTKEKFILHKEIKMLVYIIYIFILFALVTSNDFESYSNNFIPFKEIFRYSFNSKLFIRNVIGNIILFIPFGYLVTDMICSKAEKTKTLLIGVVPFITSLSIETIQLFIGRSFDIDDIILNYIGAIVGIIFYKILHVILRFFRNRYNNTVVNTIIFIIMLLVFILILFYGYEVIL